MSISYQLYCSRNFPPVADTLTMLSEAGFTEVEGFGGLFGDVDALEAGLNAAGLRMTSSHMGMDMVEGDPEGTLALARRLGIEKIFVPHIAAPDRPADAAGWESYAQRLAAAGKPFVDAGFVFGWHNHDFELVDLGGGRTPLDVIADAGVALELDLGWVKVAGHDPVEWINRFNSKISAVHVKDISPEGQAQDEDGWADVGHGVMDWAAIHAALQANGINHMVAEHDNPSDHKRFATRSLAAIKAFSA